MIRVIVAGSRSFNDYQLLKRKLDAILVNQARVEIVSGMAPGADCLGELYANRHNHSIKRMPAKWRVDGKLDRSAGIKRNVQMGDYADCLVAFWDGESSGTRHMIEYMESLSKPVRVIRFDRV